MSLRTRTLRLLRIPHEPTPPVGDRAVRVFRAAAGYFKYKLLSWLLTNIGGAIGLYFALMMSGNIERSIARALPAHVPLPGFDLTEGRLIGLIELLEYGAVLVFLLQALGALMLLRLDFEQRWYMVSDRSLRIREGLIRLHEKTMTFANVQHVSIEQGPLQRLLGIADLEVRTAGGQSSDSDHRHKDAHVAYFRGIADASGVRDFIRDRIRQFRDAGLGDHDDQQAPPSAPEDALQQAAQRLLEESRLLRTEFTTTPRD